MLGPLTTKLGTLMYYDKFSSKQKLQTTTNCLKQQKLVIVVYAYNFPVLGLLITILGTLMYYDKFSSKQKLQVCKQQQTASGNKNL